MITLCTFGPAFGLPDPSPFVMKSMMLLRLSGLDHETDTKGFNKAPKGKLPYIRDDGEVIADSTLIREHLERKYKIEFDKALSIKQRGAAWAFEKMCEDHLYWLVVQERWLNEANFNAGPRRFFKRAPAPLRPLVIAMVRRQIKRNLWGQGTSRHSDEERARIARRGIDAVADYLGDNQYFMGDAPCGADATIFAFSAGALCDRFNGPVREAALAHPNLVAYRDRMMAEFFPDYAATTGA